MTTLSSLLNSFSNSKVKSRDVDTIIAKCAKDGLFSDVEQTTIKDFLHSGAEFTTRGTRKRLESFLKSSDSQAMPGFLDAFQNKRISKTELKDIRARFDTTVSTRAYDALLSAFKATSMFNKTAPSYSTALNISGVDFQEDGRVALDGSQTGIDVLTSLEATLAQNPALFDVTFFDGAKLTAVLSQLIDEAQLLSDAEREQSAVLFGNIILPAINAAAYLDQDGFSSALELAIPFALDNCLPSVNRILAAQLKGHRDNMTSKAKRLHTKLAKSAVPKTPPYQKWFANDDTFKVTLSLGYESSIFEGAVHLLESHGLTRDWRSNGDVVYVKDALSSDGKHTTQVEVFVKENNEDGMFDAMHDDAHMVSYSGHSSFGLNVMDALENTTPSNDEKLLFMGLCSGKDSIDSIQKHFPMSQLMTTYQSSRFRERHASGRMVTESEDFNALIVLIDGVIERSTWKKISQNLKDAMFVFAPTPVDNKHNYITPIHHDIHARTVDSDGDGIVDILDNHHGVSIPGGAELSKAVASLNTLVAYNEVTRNEMRHLNILNAGFFADDGGTLIRLEEIEPRPDIDHARRRRQWSITVNDSIQGETSDFMKAFTSFEAARLVSLEDGSSRLKATIDGLVLAAASINYDASPSSEDQRIWDALLAEYDLPVLPLSDFKRAVDNAPSGLYTGSMGGRDDIINGLSDSERIALSL